MWVRVKDLNQQFSNVSTEQKMTRFKRRDQFVIRLQSDVDVFSVHNISIALPSASLVYNVLIFIL